MYSAYFYNIYIEILLKICEEYADRWKMEFNSKKSVYLSLGPDFVEASFNIKDKELPKVDSFIYLGLPGPLTRMFILIKNLKKLKDLFTL
jgi:hypothetical protein